MPLLTIQAVKELKAENDALKTTNAQQRRVLNALQKRLDAVERALNRPARKFHTR